MIVANYSQSDSYKYLEIKEKRSHPRRGFGGVAPEECSNN